MGEVWNSHLPKAGAGRPKDAKDGVRRPGIKGGQRGHSNRSQAAKDADPLYIPGNSNGGRQKPPDWADVDKIAAGQRMVHEYLHQARNIERIERIVDKQLEKAEAGDQRAAERVLDHFAGKPVAYVSRHTTGELTGDDVAKMAEAVGKELESKGIRIVQRAPAPVEIPAPATEEETA